ncbi:MAG: hypothetical protein COW50_02250 [Candidatus Moranbacteria bacterium CG17_big_fil_post_rev_8_21_14_2_50_41_107]|nr:MAG: hypothetical protein COW50_02250 [Candidatus Moranbacteria bacterium CG17_big_fil_post_rev_8_21_14_2_50_41_107]
MKMEQSKFIKDFSKQESSEERTQLAQEILEKRTKHFEDKKSIEAKEQEKSEAVKQLEALKSQIETYDDASFFVKIKDFFAIKKIERELQLQLGKQASIEEELNKSISGRQDLDETKLMVTNFYAGEKKKWAESPYSKEDIAQNFTEEHLSSLLTEDYVDLLKRFPGEMLTHVTRHGVRDHADLGNHTKGIGEYSDTLNTVLGKKELKSAIGIALQEETKEDAVAKYLKLDNCPNRKAALGRIHGQFKSAVIGDPHAFADSSAIHLAAEEVADSFYGSERGNEIFFAFPSAMVASQYEFSGDLSKAGNNNDQFVWPDVEKGLPLDAGIAFIPEDAKVDRENGSKYYLDQNKKTLPSEGIDEILKARFGEKPGFVQDLVREAEKADGLEPTEQIKKIQEVFRDYGIQNMDSAKCLTDKNLRQKLVETWGTEDEKSKYEEILTKHFQDSDLSPYKLAENPVSSQQYWEEYFQKHPEARPKHIVYYAGGDPTKALYKWREKNGISKRSGESNLGFSENEVSKKTKNEDETQQRFVSIAHKLIDKRFPSTDKVPSYEWSWND